MKLGLCNNLSAKDHIPSGWCYFPKGAKVMLRVNLDWIKRDKKARGPILVGVMVGSDEQYIEALEVMPMNQAAWLNVSDKQKRRVWIETTEGILFKPA